jgi:predicted ATPase
VTITKVVLENFKSHSRTEIPLRPLTVLVGTNCVGKTSVLEAIERVVAAGTTTPAWSSRELPLDCLKRGAERCSVTLLDESSDVEPRRLWMALDESTQTKLGNKRSLGWQRGRPGAERSAPPGIFRDPDREMVDVAQMMAGACVRLRLEAEALAAPSTISFGENTTTLSPEGRGLAGVLSLMNLFHSSRYLAVVGSVRKIVPSLREMRLHPTTFREVRTSYDDEGNRDDRTVFLDGAELRFDFIGAEDIAANAVSEGTLIALGILTVAYQSNERCLILLDDIERALHPRAQRELIRMLRQIIADNPQLQIIATSHSPYLVDEFEPEEVIVFAQRKDGTSAARPLSEHPRIKQALEVLTTGEFLAAEEEAWVTGESDG